MSLTYIPINKDIEPFDVNSAGASVLAIIYESFNLTLIAGCRIPFIASAEDVRETVAKLKTATEKSDFELDLKLKEFKLVEENFSAKVFLKSWLEFLEYSHGYSTM